MVDATRMLRLMAWLSPAFPVGAFSYSHGLERAVEDGLAIDLGDWIETLIRHGSGWNDAVLVAEAWRRAHDGGDLVELCELGEAMAGGAERHLESMAQGDAFGRSVAGWLDGFDLPGHCSYPIAFGAVAGVCDLPRETALAAWLQAFASNQIQAGIRLSLIGQDGGLALLRRLEPVVAELAAAAARSSLDDLGGAAFIAEIAAMNHETQYSRLFRS